VWLMNGTSLISGAQCRPQSRKQLARRPAASRRLVLELINRTVTEIAVSHSRRALQHWHRNFVGAMQGVSIPAAYRFNCIQTGNALAIF